MDMGLKTVYYDLLKVMQKFKIIIFVKKCDVWDFMALQNKRLRLLMNTR